MPPVTFRSLYQLAADYYYQYKSWWYFEGEKGLHYWFSIVLVQDVVHLSLRDLKKYALVSKSISKLVRDYIQRNFWFRQFDLYSYYDKTGEHNPEIRYLWYSPCNIINVKNVSSLSINTTKIKFFPTFDFPFTFPLHLQQVTHITFRDFFNQPIGCGIKSKINNLPLTLTHLTLSSHFDNSVDDLPPNLTFLSCGYAFNSSVDSLPLTLTHLYLSDCFNNPIDSLPLTLTHLYLSDYFNNSVDSLPPKLTHLTLPGNLNQPINSLPLSLTHLTFTDTYYIKFKQPLDQLQRNFETNLEYLVLSPIRDHWYEYSIPPNFMRLVESEQLRDHIVYKKR